MIVQENENQERGKRAVPILFNQKEDCCGCSACYAICPKRAIIMVMDEEGFEYPMIKTELCISCKRCMRVCPFKSRLT